VKWNKYLTSIMAFGIKAAIVFTLCWIFLQARKNSSQSPILSLWRPSCFQGQRQPLRILSMYSIYWYHTPTPRLRLSTALNQQMAKRVFLTFSPGLYPLEYFVGSSTKTMGPKSSHNKITKIKIFFCQGSEGHKFWLKISDAVGL
jgi:hypothetical protein